MTWLVELGLINAAVATVAATAVWLVTRRCRHPALVHTLWVIVLLKLITPPIVTIPWHFAVGDQSTQISGTGVPEIIRESAEPSNDVFQSTSMSDSIVQSEWQRAERSPKLPAAFTESKSSAPLVGEARSVALIQTYNEPAPAVELTVPWMGLALGVWLIGSSTFIAISAWRVMRFHRALVRTQPAPNVVSQLADEVASRFLLSGRYGLRITEGRLPPLVWPVGRPTIVLPRYLVTELSSEELQTLLAHELAHLRRRDHWVRWLELVATAIYWWHPVVWWARTAIQQSEEEACDAWVVSALPHSAARYASALFKAAQFVSERHPPEPILVSALGSSGKLKERIEHVMNTTWKPRLLLPVRLTVLLLALLILPLSLRTVGATGEPEASQRQQVETTDDAAAQNSAETASGPAVEAQATPDTEQSTAQSNDAANAPDAASDVLDQAPTDSSPRDVPADAAPPKTTTDAGDPNGVPLLKDLPAIGRLFRTGDSAVDGSDPDNPASNTERAQRIRVGTLLSIRIFPVVLENPIGDVTHVDSQGRVALGPLFGRVKLDGMTVDEAEAALLKHLNSLNVIREPRVQVTLIGNPNEYRRVPMQHHPYLIKAGDIIAVTVSNGAPDAPIEGDFMVEPSGAVPLGPLYGRVTVAGLTLEDAEKAVAAHLQKQLKDPKVQITIGGWRDRATSFADPMHNAPGDPWASDDPWASPGRTPASVQRSTPPKTPTADGANPWPSSLEAGSTGNPAAGWANRTPSTYDWYGLSATAPAPTQNLATEQAPPRQANAQELEAMREHVQFLENHFKKADALFQSGSRGGSAFAQALAGYELAAAQGELALAEGNQPRALTQFEEAQKYAEQALIAAQAAHRAGMVTDDALLEAAKSVSEIKRRRSVVRYSTSSAENVSSDAAIHSDSALPERTQLVSTSSGTESLGVLKKIAERAKLDYDRVKELAEKNAVSATERARAKSDFEISLERVRQAERGLKYHQLLLESAEADYQMLLEANKVAPHTVPQLRLRKAKLAVELAKAKLDELSE